MYGLKLFKDITPVPEYGPPSTQKKAGTPMGKMLGKIGGRSLSTGNRQNISTSWVRIIFRFTLLFGQP